MINVSKYQVNNDENFPTILNNLIGKDYTLKLKVQMDNIIKKSEFYLVTDIMEGFLMEPYQQQQTTIPHPIESLEAQASSSKVLYEIINEI